MPSNTHRIRIPSRGNLCGVCPYMFTNCSFLGFSSLILDMCHVWGGCVCHQHIPNHSEQHPQSAFSRTAKLDLAPPLRQSPLAYLQRALLISARVTGAFARLLLKNINRACGVIFHALFTRPQTQLRALITAPTSPNHLQKSPKLQLCGTRSNVQLCMSA